MMVSYPDALDERIDAAKDVVVSAARGMVAQPPPNYGALDGLRSALRVLDELESRSREESEGEAVDQLATRIGHLEGCDYTLKATTSEMAVHFALFLANGGPLPACGDVGWWPHGGIPPVLPVDEPVRMKTGSP